MTLEFGIGTTYYYIFLAVSCLIGRALCLGYLRFFRGKKVLLYGDALYKSSVIVSFFFIILSFIDNILVIEFDLPTDVATSIIRLLGLLLSMWGDYILETIINFPTFTSTLYKALCMKLDKEYKEEDNPFNTNNPHKEEHKELLTKISKMILDIEECFGTFRREKEDRIIIDCYRAVSPEYIKIRFEYEYIPISDVETTLEKQMSILDNAYGMLVQHKDSIVLKNKEKFERENETL